MLLHFIEHFIFSVYPQATSTTDALVNQSVWDALFFVFAGKSFTIFVILYQMLAQIWFCKAWLKRHKQGPLEALWHKLTWFSFK